MMVDPSSRQFLVVLSDGHFETGYLKRSFTQEAMAYSELQPVNINQGHCRYLSTSEYQRSATRTSTSLVGLTILSVTDRPGEAPWGPPGREAAVLHQSHDGWSTLGFWNPFLSDVRTPFTQVWYIFPGPWTKVCKVRRYNGVKGLFKAESIGKPVSVNK